MLLEPVTSITDVLLFWMASVLAWRLFSNAPRPLPHRDLCWVGSFATLAVACGLGALVHGFSLEPLRSVTWDAIRGWTTLSEVCFFLGALSTVFGNRAGRRATPA